MSRLSLVSVLSRTRMRWSLTSLNSGPNTCANLLGPTLARSSAIRLNGTAARRNSRFSRFNRYTACGSEGSGEKMFSSKFWMSVFTSSPTAV